MRPKRRRYSSRNGGGSNAAGVFLILLVVVGLAVYFGAAGVVGNWLAEKVVSPMMTALGIWDEADKAANPAQTNAPEQTNAATPVATGASADPVASQPPAYAFEAQMSGLNAYFLQTGAFELEGNASVEAGELKTRGGAGYVAADNGKYRVFLSTYANRADAESVHARLTGEGVESRVHVMECAGKSVGVSTDAQKAALEAAVAKYTAALSCLNQASMSIEDPAKSAEQAAAAATEFQAVRTELDKGFASGENAHADELYELAGTMAAEAGAATDQSAIQHTYAKACFEYAALVNSM